MTEYQKIEKELVALGWKPEQRNGDHIRFSKEGASQMITIPLNINDKARALKNTYAEIRRIEPLFSLGRQKHMLPKAGEDQDTKETDTLPEGLPDWLSTGRSVRWTGPENRDWSRLADPGSVMNHPYTVRGFIDTNGGPMVVITGQNEDEPFSVFPKELDAWETAECCRCSAKMPANQLVADEQGNRMCVTCFEEARKETVSVSPETSAKTKKKDTDKDLADSDPLVQELSALFKELEETPANELDKEKREELLSKTREALERLPSKSRKALRKKFPKIMEFLEPAKEKKTPKTPYEAWKKALNDIIDFRAVTRKLDRQAVKTLTTALFSCTYSISRLKDPRDKKTDAATLITVNTKDWDTTHTIWTHAIMIINCFHDTLPPIPVFLLVNCPSTKFRQYTPSLAADDYPVMLKTLEDCLPESERKYLARARKNLLLPPAKDILNKLYDKLSAAVPDTKKNTGLSLQADADDPDGVEGSYETALPFYTVEIIVADEDEGHYYDKIHAQFKDGEHIDAPLRVTVYDWKTGMSEFFDTTNLYTYPEEKTDTQDKSEKETDWLLQIEWNNGQVIFHANEVEEENRDRIIASLCCSAEQDETWRTIYRDALKRFREKAETDEDIMKSWKEITGLEPIENNQMEQKDILDNTNPGQSELGGFTTRALLKELRLRGVEFDNLTITVRKTINVDDI